VQNLHAAAGTEHGSLLEKVVLFYNVERAVLEFSWQVTFDNPRRSLWLDVPEPEVRSLSNACGSERANWFLSTMIESRIETSTVS
jgi:hypothetical protein